MALGAKDKTYTIDANRAMAAPGTGIRDAKLKLYNAIRTSLLASGKWAVSSSSNCGIETVGGDPSSPYSVGLVGASDNWSATAHASTVLPAPVHAGAVTPSAGRFPWVVLTNATLGCHVMFSEENGGNNNNGKVYISFSAGFSGGTAGARPTATDEIAVSNGGATFSGVDTAHKINTWVSSDGQVTNVMVWRGTTNMCIFWRFCKPKNPASGWTNPCSGVIQIIAAGLAISYANLSAFTNSRGLTTQSGNINLGWTGESDRSGASFSAEVTDIGTVVNTLTGNWTEFRIGVCSKTTGSKGRHGSLYDIYWKSGTTMADADTIPNNAAARDWVCAGPIILPWTGDATVMALT